MNEVEKGDDWRAHVGEPGDPDSPDFARAREPGRGREAMTPEQIPPAIRGYCSCTCTSFSYILLLVVEIRDEAWRVRDRYARQRSTSTPPLISSTTSTRSLRRGDFSFR